MTKITQLMPELLVMRSMVDEQWRIHGPDGDIVISRIEVERLIADNTRLREALEYIATNTTHYMHEWVRNYARTALEKK